MRTASAALANHLAGEITTLATCWKLTRRDGTVMGFTDHVADLVVSGVTYKAATGISPTTIASSDTFSVDNLEVQGILDSTAITESDIVSGRYDYAAVSTFMVNVQDLTQGAILYRTGWLGEISVKNGQFNAEVRGLTQKLQQNIGQLFSPSCRAVLGDARCKVNLAGFTFTGTVGVVASPQVFATGLTQANGYFGGGQVNWTSGANIGLSMEIKQFIGGQITLVLPMPFTIVTGDQFTAIAGCDKTITTCANIFANAANFRGEPYVPGMDSILTTASTQV